MTRKQGQLQQRPAKARPVPTQPQQDHQQPDVQPAHEIHFESQRLKRDYEHVLQQLQQRDEELARVKVLRRDNMQSVLGADGSTEDRCLAMEIMGRVLNRQAYDMALATRAHTASLDALSAYMAASADDITGVSLQPTSAQSTPAPVWNTPLPPPYNAATPTHATPLVPGRPLQALFTPQPPPYTPVVHELPPRSPAILSALSSPAPPQTPAPPRTLARSTCAPAGVSACAVSETNRGSARHSLL